MRLRTKKYNFKCNIIYYKRLIKIETKLYRNYAVNSCKALYIVRMRLLNHITHLQGRSLCSNNLHLTKLTSSPFIVIGVVSSFIASRACFTRIA